MKRRSNSSFLLLDFLLLILYIDGSMKKIAVVILIIGILLIGCFFIFNGKEGNSIIPTPEPKIKVPEVVTLREFYQENKNLKMLNFSTLNATKCETVRDYSFACSGDNFDIKGDTISNLSIQEYINNHISTYYANDSNDSSRTTFNCPSNLICEKVVYSYINDDGTKDKPTYVYVIGSQFAEGNGAFVEYTFYNRDITQDNYQKLVNTIKFVDSPSYLIGKKDGNNIKFTLKDSLIEPVHFKADITVDATMFTEISSTESGCNRTSFRLNNEEGSFEVILLSEGIRGFLPKSEFDVHYTLGGKEAYFLKNNFYFCSYFVDDKHSIVINIVRGNDKETEFIEDILSDIKIEIN